MDVHYLKIDGVEYPACFSMGATEDIIKEFGGMTEMSEGMMANDVTTIGKMIQILVDAGYEYCDMKGIECTPKPRGRLIALMDIKETAAITEKIFGIIKTDSDRTVETSSKN